MKLEIKLNPPQEVIIHEISVFKSADEMARVYTAGMSCFHDQFKWVNGVVMMYSAVDPSFNSVFAKEMIDGKVHWQWVSVAPMPKYSERIKVENFLTVSVKDVTYSKKFVEIGRFLYDWVQLKLKENDAYPYSANKALEISE